MHTLFLDLASHDGCIACVDDTAVIALRDVHPKITDRELVELYESLIQDAAWMPADIDRIACITGPGGFTSLRVAAAFANALSYALAIPAAGIHLSDFKKAQSMTENLLWMHSTKKTELFVRGFGNVADRLGEPQCIKIDDLGQYAKSGDVWTGELIPEHRALVDQMALMEATKKSVSDVLPSFVSSLAYEKQRIDPWYGRGW